MSVWQPPTESPDLRRVGSVASRFKHLAARYIVPASTTSSGLRLAFDAEADGFVDQATKVHCIVVANLDSEEIDAYGPDRIPLRSNICCAPITSSGITFAGTICRYCFDCTIGRRDPTARSSTRWSPAG